MDFLNATGAAIFSHPLGEAATIVQLQRTVSAFSAFCAIYSATRQFAATFMPVQWKQLEEYQKFKLGTQVTSMFHSIYVVSSCLHLAYVRKDPSIEKDHMYGYSDRANFIFAVSTAFFMWDLLVLFAPQQKKMQYEFLLHHALCMVAYVLVQHPFLHYHSIRMLIMEFSSPFLALRNILLSIGKTENSLYKALKAIFALSFFAARILYAIPVSGLALYETYTAYMDGRVHTTFAACYIAFANIGASCLNLLWLSKMYKMATKGSSTSSKKNN